MTAKRSRSLKNLAKIGSILGCGLICFSRVPIAHAGNLDSFYVSGEAALAAGAVVATSSSGGSIWYNPAGLARLTGMRLDVNVSGYAVRFGANVNFDSTLPGASERRLTLMELDVVPAAVTLTRRFGRFGVGVGVFVPAQTGVTLRTYLSAPADANGTSLEFGYDSKSSVQGYHLGPAVGWDVLDNLSLGLSLLANYRTLSESTDVSAALHEGGDDPGQVGWARHHRLDSVGVGLELVWGMQWRFLNRWALGAVVRSPSLRLGHAAEQIDTEITTNRDGSVTQNINFDESIAIGTQILSPFRFHLGLSRSFRDWTFAAEGSLQLPFKNEPLDLHDRATLNLRTGITKILNPTWAIGGGVFSDRSSAPNPTDFLDTQIDYYGATFAVKWKSPYGVYSRGDEVLEQPESLIFSTTLSLSYALGLGTIAGALVGPGPSGGIQIASNPADVIAHEFTLHIATTVSE